MWLLKMLIKSYFKVVRFKFCFEGVNVRTHASVWAGHRLFKVEKQFSIDMYWGFYETGQDFFRIVMSLGVRSKYRVQEQETLACPGSV